MEEEMELRIFDYLEGNLSEAEAAEVKHLIETQQDWSRAYRLMKLTYLDPETLSAGEQEFPHKERLYRRERRPRVFTLYYGAAASVLLCGLAWLLWKPSDSSLSPAMTRRTPAAAALPEKSSAASAERLAVIPRKKRKIRKGHGGLSTQKVPLIQEPKISETIPPEPEMLPFAAMGKRAVFALPGLANIPLPAGPVRFINGMYIPVQQRRSLLRYRLQEEGRELLAWVSEPRVMLVRTRREGARDRMELRLETKRIGIIATLTD